MKIITKIILSFVVIILVAVISTLITAAMGNKVSTGGFGPFLIYPLGIAGIIAIWKRK